MVSKRGNRLPITAAVGVLIVLVSGTAAAPAVHAKEGSQPTEPKVVRVTIPFDHPISLRHAIETRSWNGRPVQAYSFASRDVVGEYSLSSETSVDDFLQHFDNLYGTQPQVVGVVVLDDIDDVEKRAASGENASRGTYAGMTEQGSAPAPPTTEFAIETSFPEYVAPPTAEGSAARTREKGPMVVNNPERAELTASTTGTAARWDPDQADIQVIDAGSSVWISQWYSWVSLDASPDYMPAKWGMEFEVNAFSALSIYQSGTRPYCADAVTGSEFYKAQPFAMNVNWDWSVYVNTGSGLTPGAESLGAYPDYNDLSDQCNRNSLAIGIADPWVIPFDDGGVYNLQLNILAPKGVEPTGRISGVIQAVDRHYCQDSVPWMPLTDCMNVFPEDWPGPGQTYRPTLAAWREWTAPTTCWVSFVWGSEDPLDYPC